MPGGVKTWDDNGVLTLDTNSIVGLLFGSIQMAENQMSGSVSNPKFANGKPFAVPLLNYTLWAGANRRVVALTQINISFSGTTMSWSRVAKSSLEQSAPAGVIHYGVYSGA